VVAVKDASDRDRESQSLNLARRLNDGKKDGVLGLVNLLTEYLILLSNG